MRPRRWPSLARAGGVDRVRAPFAAVPLATQSEGVATTAAVDWHARNLRGAGAKVAIIDVGFAGYHDRIAAGELPPTLAARDFCGGAMGAPDPHGTAVAEIVHEMAPAAQLSLICIETEVDLAQAVEYVKANGITIVNHSVGWLNTARGDGSGAAGTPDALVADARANGVLWINSAGNSALAHWSGPFSDPDGNRRHNFAGSDEGNSLALAPGKQICGFLKWDAWPVTDQDFNLYLELNGMPVAWSFEPQDGAHPPAERVCYSNGSSATQTVSFVIERVGDATTPRFDLFVSIGGLLQYGAPAGSILEPATSPHVFTVGAICWQNSSLEPYSSRGPTIDGRVKPDLAAPSAVSSAQYGPFSACATSAFTGTSSSAPHVAGAAALWKGLLPLSTVDDLRTMLQADAADLGAFGIDSTYGAGRLRLPTSTATATTLAGAGSATKTTAPVAATVNARGLPTTFVWQYGTAPGTYGAETAPVAAGSGRTDASYAHVLTGLSAARTYYFRVKTTNLFGVSYGAERSVTTLAAQPPTVLLGPPVLGATRATIVGAVNPNETATTYSIQWGRTPAYELGQTARIDIGGGVHDVPISHTLTGLVRNTVYRYRVVAESADGTTDSGERVFTTAVEAAPTVTTGAATSLTSSSAQIAGVVNPRGEQTTYTVQYGPTAAYGAQSAPVAVGFGSAPVDVATTLGGLAASTTYHYRIVASNAVGTTHGLDATLTTGAAPPGGGGSGGGGGVAGDVEVSFAASSLTPAVNEVVEVRVFVRNKSQDLAARGLRAAIGLPVGTTLLGPPAFDRGSGCTGAAVLDCNLDYLPGATTTLLRFSLNVGAAGRKSISVALTSTADPDEANNTGVLALDVRGGQGPTALTTAAAPRVRAGNNRANVLNGTSGPDLLRGLGGDDWLLGLGGADKLFGGAGNDHLVGGPGRDVLDGGTGKDRIEARDKARDVIRCGPGRDTVIADRVDSVARTCEVVRRR